MHVTVHFVRPTRESMRAAFRAIAGPELSYLVLLQVGFAVPPSVTAGAVRSYRTISPLPSLTMSAWAVCFLLHFPWARAPQALPGTFALGARTFLCLPWRLTAIAWLTPGRTLWDCGALDKLNYRADFGTATGLWRSQFCLGGRSARPLTL